MVLAYTKTKVSGSVIGNKRTRVYDIDCTEYAANGIGAITPASIGMRKFSFVEAHPKENLGYVAQWDYANNKLKVFYGNYDSSDGVLIEVAGTPDVGVFRVKFEE